MQRRLVSTSPTRLPPCTCPYPSPTMLGASEEQRVSTGLLVHNYPAGPLLSGLHSSTIKDTHFG